MEGLQVDACLQLCLALLLASAQLRAAPRHACSAAGVARRRGRGGRGGRGAAAARDAAVPRPGGAAAAARPGVGAGWKEGQGSSGSHFGGRAGSDHRAGPAATGRQPGSHAAEAGGWRLVLAAACPPVCYGSTRCCWRCPPFETPRATPEHHVACYHPMPCCLSLPRLCAGLALLPAGPARGSPGQALGARRLAAGGAGGGLAAAAAQPAGGGGWAAGWAGTCTLLCCTHPASRRTGVACLLPPCFILLNAFGPQAAAASPCMCSWRRRSTPPACTRSLCDSRHWCGAPGCAQVRAAAPPLPPLAQPSCCWAACLPPKGRAGFWLSFPPSLCCASLVESTRIEREECPSP